MEEHTYQLKPLQKSHLKEMVFLDSICFSKEDAYPFEVMNYFFSKPYSSGLGYFFEDILIGFILFEKNHIITIDVHPDHRRRGLGKNLIEYAILIIKKNRYKKIFLEVDAENFIAIKLYEKFGFQIRERFTENNKLRYIMELNLK